MDYYNNLHCDNKELIEELKQKEELFSRISERILRCPHCGKGHFIRDNDGSEYSDDFWVCDKCDNYPSATREQHIENIVFCGEDFYWDYEIYEYVSNFEYAYPRTYTDDEQKVRQFSAEEWDKEEKHYLFGCEQNKNRKWKDIVESTINDHIKALDTAIERAKKVKMLKSIFKEKTNDTN